MLALAWFNLLHQKTRTLIAVAGVAFAVLLVFMQLGFYGAAARNATIVYDELDFDIVIQSTRYLEFNAAGTFPRERLFQARNVEGVARVEPLLIGFGSWRSRERPGGDGKPQRIMVLGCRLTETPFRRDGKDIQGAIDAHRDALRLPGNVLGDTSSRPSYGTMSAGRTAQFGSIRVHLVGSFELGTGFGANGLILAGDGTFLSLVQGYSPGEVSLGLVRLREGADPDEVARRLNAAFPADVRARTRDQTLSQEQTYWLWGTSIGLTFFLGVIVALVVGIVFVYQVISSDVAGRIREFATLKAMGYRDGKLSSVVLVQAWLVAILGYVPGLLLAVALYWLAADNAAIPISMTPVRLVLVFGLALAMCSFSGLLAARKLATADPADLF